MPILSTTRDWLRRHPTGSDGLLAVAVFAAALIAHPPSDAFNTVGSPLWLTAVLAAAACALLVARRSYPVPVWLGTWLISALSLILAHGPSSTILPALIGLYTVAANTSRRFAALAGLVTAVTMTTILAVVSDQGLLTPETYAMLAWFGMAAAIGDATRGRRTLLAAAEERARRAEQSREEEALRRVAEERVRIARDLHDVVAHHIAVISVQAGVADHLMASDPAKARESLQHVRTSSQLVLTEMATILGLLRSSDEVSVTSPSPVLSDAEVLVEAVRQTGMDVSFSVSGDPSKLPSGVSLTAYRLVQEALTNAGKHGTGSAAVRLSYLPDTLLLDVTNPVARAAQTPTEGGTGHGLLGMRERVMASGGRLQTGIETDTHGGLWFGVHAELPVNLGQAVLLGEGSP